MGLSLVRAIVTRHGGSVQLFSQEGVGTSVRMVLPVLADAAPVTVPQMSDHMDRVAAGSHAVQPVQQADSRQAPGFLPPRQPNEAELQGRILGTPRRTSKRRLERVDGNLVNRRTGESVSGGFPPDSGQHSQFKPPRQAPNVGGQNPGYGQPPVGSQPNSGPQYSGPQQSGQPNSGPQNFGQPPVGSQPASGPQPTGQPPVGGQPNSGPQNFGNQPVGSQPNSGQQNFGQPPVGSEPASGPQQSGQPPVGSQNAGQPNSGPQAPRHGYGQGQPNQNGREAGYPDRRQQGDQQ